MAVVDAISLGLKPAGGRSEYRLALLLYPTVVSRKNLNIDPVK